jgi:hypothetical protein
VIKVNTLVPVQWHLQTLPSTTTIKLFNMDFFINVSLPSLSSFSSSINLPLQSLSSSIIRIEFLAFGIARNM